MATLELCGDGLDGGRVLGRMLFPHDEPLRQSHYVRELVEQEISKVAGGDGLIRLPIWVMQSLLTSPGPDEIHRRTAEATKRGTVAGDLLALAYEMNGQGLNWPSFGKAIEFYKGFALGRKYGDGEALKYSEQTLRSYWNEYKPVAHLWAAFRLNQGPYAYESDPRAVFHEQQKLLRFLGVAKGAADFASTFIPKGTKPPRPLIASDEMIAISADVPAIRLTFSTHKLESRVV